MPMTALRRLLFPLLLASPIGVLADASVRAQEIWLAPQPKAVDLIDMFKPDAPWKDAASRTQVFKFYGNPFINPTPQDQLDTIVADVTRRRIAIALETGVMNLASNPRPPCGGWGLVEGYGPVALHELMAKKIKRAGGVIKYIAMDEPLWYGHYFKGGTPRFPQPGCQSSIGDVVKLIAPSLNVYIREFPDVSIGDIEPSNLADVGPGRGRSPDWQNDLATWAAAFRAEIGRPLAFLHLDVGWEQPQASQNGRMVYDYARELVRRQLIGKLGIIYNGNASDSSDAAWLQAARDHVALMERDYGLHPDQAIIQSWHPHPSHAMPESSQDTLTSLVDFYTARKSASPSSKDTERRQ